MDTSTQEKLKNNAMTLLPSSHPNPNTTNMAAMWNSMHTGNMQFQASQMVMDPNLMNWSMIPPTHHSTPTHSNPYYNLYPANA